MDLIILGFLFALSVFLIGFGLLKATPISLLLGGMILVLFSGLVFAVGYDIDYNPSTSSSLSSFTYDSNNLVKTSVSTIYQVNSTNSITVKWLGMVGITLGALLSLFSLFGLMSRANR